MFQIINEIIVSGSTLTLISAVYNPMMLIPYTIFEAIFIGLDVAQEKNQRDQLRYLQRDMESKLSHIFRVNLKNAIQCGEAMGKTDDLYLQALDFTEDLDNLFAKLFDTFEDILEGNYIATPIRFRNSLKNEVARHKTNLNSDIRYFRRNRGMIVFHSITNITISICKQVF